MAWVERTSIIQFMAKDFEDAVTLNGWELKLRQRLCSSDKNNFAEVRLFETVGTDGEIRRMGVVHPYNKEANRADFDDYDHVSKGSRLGSAGRGDGEKTLFRFPVYPIDQSKSFSVYIGNELIKKKDYNIDYEKATIEFDSPPPKDAKVEGEFFLAQNSIDPTTKMIVFTFNTLLDDIENAVDDGGYVIDVEIENAFKGKDAEQVMDAVFAHYTFLHPSPPTVISYLEDDVFGHAYKRDSEIELWGNINPERIIMNQRFDAAPGAKNAYYTTLYFGRIHAAGDWGPQRNTVIIGTCRPEDEIKVVRDKRLGGRLIDYGRDTSNGNTGVQVHLSVGGIYYQRHYLRFITHSNDAEDQYDDGLYNPTMCDDLYRLPRMGIVHPNDGLIGWLDDCYAIHPKNIRQKDDLEINEEVKNESLGFSDGERKVFYSPHRPVGVFDMKADCEFVPDFIFNLETKGITFKEPIKKDAELIANYRFNQIYNVGFTTAPISPFTLEKLTPYAPIGLAVLKKVK